MSARSISPYKITPKIARDLLRIESVKERVAKNPLNSINLSYFQEKTRFYSTYYSTMLEGNRLEPEQISSILKNEKLSSQNYFEGYENDEKEIIGYNAALLQIEVWVKNSEPITEKKIQILHALMMDNQRDDPTPSPYRISQNLVYNGRTNSIAYVPPIAKEVPTLIKSLVAWIQDTNEIPSPIVAGIAHYQLISIHPFYLGNGRIARLLVTYILRKAGYDLEGVGSLEEYYANNLNAYFEAISMSPIHNYFFGRREADITPWVQYFIEALATSLEKAFKKIEGANRDGIPSETPLIRKLDTKQRQALDFFREYITIQAHQIP